MSKRTKFIANLGLYALAAGLLFYAASRTLDFVSSTMPVDKTVWGYLFLLSTGGGALIWLLVYLHKAEGAKQRGLAFVMGIIDLAGELVMVYADTVRVASENGLLEMSQSELSTFITASVAIMGANLAAVYVFHLFDPQAERDSQARDLVDEVTEATMKQLNTPEERQKMIDELSPVLSSAVIADVRSQVHAAAGMFAKKSSLADELFSKPLGKVKGSDKTGFFEKLSPRRLRKFGRSDSDEIVWTENEDGTRRRILCKICLAEGKDWASSEPCEHVLGAEGEPIQIKTNEGAMNARAMKNFAALLDELEKESGTGPAKTGVVES